MTNYLEKYLKYKNKYKILKYGGAISKKKMPTTLKNELKTSDNTDLKLADVTKDISSDIAELKKYLNTFLNKYNDMPKNEIQKIITLYNETSKKIDKNDPIINKFEQLKDKFEDQKKFVDIFQTCLQIDSNIFKYIYYMYIYFTKYIPKLNISNLILQPRYEYQLWRSIVGQQSYYDIYKLNDDTEDYLTFFIPVIKNELKFLYYEKEKSYHDITVFMFKPNTDLENIFDQAKLNEPFNIIELKKELNKELNKELTLDSFVKEEIASSEDNISKNMLYFIKPNKNSGLLLENNLCLLLGNADYKNISLYWFLPILSY